MSFRLNCSERYAFCGCIFDPKARAIEFQGKKHQLRKKECDVLLLLCSKHPQPVTHDDFLNLVWQGGYVTSQSIAQVIHSLRRIMNDKERSVIVTLPKLGYKLNFSEDEKIQNPDEVIEEPVVIIEQETSTPTRSDDSLSGAKQFYNLNSHSRMVTISLICIAFCCVIAFSLAATTVTV